MNSPLATTPDLFNSTTWFVCSQANPGVATRLFLFPYAGGGPALFSKWFAEPHPLIERWAVHYPGRGSRHHEPPIKNIFLLAGALSRAIQPFLDQPFVFFGHSFGALVAYELALHLRRRGLPQPNILFVSACSAPHLLDPQPPIHELPDPEFLKSLQKLNGIPSELLHQPDVIQLLLPILRADFEAIESYLYTPDELPLNRPIIAFGGLSDPRVSRARLEGWASHTDSSFKSQYFPGDHFFVNTARKLIMASIAAEIKALSHS